MTQALKVINSETLEILTAQHPNNSKDAKTTHPLDDRKYYNCLKRDYLLFSL